MFKALKEWGVVQHIRVADPLAYGQTSKEICVCVEEDMLCDVEH